MRHREWMESAKGLGLACRRLRSATNFAPATQAFGNVWARGALFKRMSHIMFPTAGPLAQSVRAADS
jgi:hypothetical protein